MLRKETIENLKNVFLKQNENNPYVIHFLQIDQDFYSVNYEIGKFDFYYNEGYIVLPTGKKEYKRFSSLMNAIFKIEEFFGWDSSIVENAKKAAQNLKEEEKKQREIELKKYEEGKASKFIESINNNENNVIEMIENKLMDKTEEEIKQIAINSFKNVSAKTINGVVNAIMNKINELNNPIETTSNNEKEKQETEETTYIVFNRSFDSYESALNYCKENDFSSEYIEKVVTNRQPSNNTEKSDLEIFHLYNNTFDNYMDAYNYAIRHQIPVTMILSNKHPFMTNERLKQLEYAYTFDKFNMDYEDMKEYFNFISEQPHSLDQEDKYYKLKGWIERKEYQFKQKEEKKKRQKEMIQLADKQLHYMVANGLEIKENKSIVSYYLKGEKVHHWFSGIPTEEYCKGIENVYNTYFNSQ